MTVNWSKYHCQVSVLASGKSSGSLACENYHFSFFCCWSSVDHVLVDMSTERRPTCRSWVDGGVDRYHQSTLDRGCH